MSRTNAAEQHALYNRITVQEAARRMSVTPEHVLVLGRAGELDIIDLRRPGAERGVYRVTPESVEALMQRRTIGQRMSA